MSRAAIALLIKFAMTLTLAVVIFKLFGRNTLVWVFPVSAVVTFLNYLLGDFYILPRSGNIFASAGNGIMAALTAYLVSFFIPSFMTTNMTLTAFAVLIAVGEYIFHRYMLGAENAAPY